MASPRAERLMKDMKHQVSDPNSRYNRPHQQYSRSPAKQLFMEEENQQIPLLQGCVETQN